MEVLVVYDVSTVTLAGQARLRRVAKVCEAYGQRVQKSVFECILNEMQYQLLKRDLLAEIDQRQDSLRMYRLREPHGQYIFVAGRRVRHDLRGPLIL
jgi:CRISPR-associated protein Cas2